MSVLSDKSITLHPKLGINARLLETQCPICLKVHNPGLIMLGNSNRVDTCMCGAHVYGGITRNSPCPKCKSTDHVERRELDEWEKIPCPPEPCNECSDWMKQGIIFYSVKDDDPNQHTGCMSVVKEEVIDRMPIDDDMRANIRRKRACAISDEAWDKMGLPRENYDSRKKGDNVKDQT